MRLSYDFHIHTALSPCGDMDMTPNNIVNMAALKGLDAIAITDHNTCGNAAACMAAGRKAGIAVLPGLEVESAEAVHNLCIFTDIEAALKMEKLVKESLPFVKNRADIFGREVFMDENDNETGEEEVLLLNSCGLSVYEIKTFTENLGGVYIPAHIDRDSYGIISSLGIYPEDLGARLVEVSKSAPEGFFDMFKKTYGDDFAVLTDSDAHYLENISEKDVFLEVQSNSTIEIVNTLKRMSENGK